MRSGSVRRMHSEIVAVSNSDAPNLAEANAGTGDRNKSASMDENSKNSAGSDGSDYKVVCSTPRGMRGPGVLVVPCCTSVFHCSSALFGIHASSM
jgi:hypothetical protein